MLLTRAIALFVLRRRFVVLVAVVAVTMLCGSALRRLSVSHDPRDQLPADDPDILRLDAFSDRFGAGETLAIVVEAPNVFHAPVLHYLRDLTAALEDMKGVDEVFSLANAATLATEDGSLQGIPFLPDIPEDTAALASLRESALANEQWAGSLVSRDGSVAAITVLLDQDLGDIKARRAMVIGLRERATTACPPGVSVHVTGRTPVVVDAAECLRGDLRNFLWMTPLVMAVLLFFLFRRAGGVVIPLVLVVLSCIWTLGAFFAAGLSISLTTAMMPTLVGLICLSDVIHTLAYYEEMARDGGDRQSVIATTMQHMMPACFMTSLTTAVGFGALATSRVRSIHEFGVWTAVGIVLAYILVITVVPILLSFCPPPRPRKADRERGATAWDCALRGVVRLVRDHSRAVVVAAVLLTALCIAGVARLQIEARLSDHLPTSAPSVLGLRAMQGKLAGVTTLEIELSGPAGTFHEPWAIRQIDALQQHSSGLPGVDRAMSMVDALAGIHASLEPEAAALARLPDDAGDIEEYLLLVSMSERAQLMDRLLTPDASHARISVRLRDMGTRALLATLKAVDQFTSANVDKRLMVETTGSARIFASQVTALVHSQLRSLGYSMLAITLLMIVYLRSLRSGIISMLPNGLSVLLTLGLMGASRIPLNVSTVMISCIAIGIAVDNAIHFLARYRRERERQEDREAALAIAIIGTGRAMIGASIVIAGGFSVFLLSAFGPNRYFGLLTGFTMLTALVADLVLLPCLVAWWDSDKAGKSLSP